MPSDGTGQCDTCGQEQGGPPVVGWHFVYVGNDEGYAFCSEDCYGKHWVSSEVDGGQKRLHEVDDE